MAVLKHRALILFNVDATIGDYSSNHHLECPDGQNQRSTCEAEVK